jgi:hypothetical protein
VTACGHHFFFRLTSNVMRPQAATKEGRRKKKPQISQIAQIEQISQIEDR